MESPFTAPLSQSLSGSEHLSQIVRRESLTRMNANRELLYQHVKFLTTLRPFRNYQNLESLEKVCRYLRGEFDKYGLEAVEQTFDAARLQSTKTSSPRTTQRNKDE